MTKRELYNAILAGEITDEVLAGIQAELDKLDHTNEVRAAKAAEKRVEKEAEKAPIREAVLAVITDEPKTASDLIAEAGVEIKPQAIPALLKGLVEAGTVAKVDVKVKGKGTQRGYIRG